MPEAKPKKIVYLFGAGATHAELANLDLLATEKQEKERGLLIKNVSSRVIEKARSETRYRKDVGMVSGTSGSLDIELLISLIEHSKIDGWEYKTGRLKDLVEKDIKSVLTPSRTKRFYLHNTLFRLHEHKIAKAKERVIGLISLNYDDVLDQAYKAVLRKSPNYSWSLEANAPSSMNIPLLKLHGSFNWKSQLIRGRTRRIEIIPFGSNKSYLHAPYSFIWNRALEVLIECDTLRVIGCSLSQNDAHLIDLLFKAHLERSEAFEIEIISSEETGQRIRSNYGFFPRITTIQNLEEHLIPDLAPRNPFKTWLKYKSIAMIGKGIKRAKYLKAVLSWSQ